MPTISTPTQAEDALNEEARQSSAFANRFQFAGVGGDGQSQQGGQQAQQDGPPQLQLPPIRTNLPDRPERNQDMRDLQMIVQGLGALATVGGASADSGLLTSVGAGLSEGAASAQQQAEESYQQRMTAYEKFLRDQQQARRERRRAQAEANYEARLADYQLQRQEELDQPSESEKALNRARANYYEAGVEERRAGAEADEARAGYYRRRPAGGGSPEDDLPDSPDQLETELKTTEQQIKALRNRYQNVPTDVYGNPDEVRRRQIGGRIDELILRREAVNQKLQRMQRSQERGRDQGGQRGNETGIPDDQLMENRDTVFNQGGAGAPGTAAPRQSGQTGGQPGRGQSGRSERGRDRPRDVSNEVPERIRSRILQQIPAGEDTTEALNAAALVLSDTTSFTPDRFERAYGFNPFQ